jgi:hypothetical protein
MSKNEKLEKVLKKVFFGVLDHNGVIYKNNENYIVMLNFIYFLKKGLGVFSVSII